jgi:hypothetical protein
MEIDTLRTRTNDQNKLLMGIYRLLYKKVEGIDLYQHEKNAILESIDKGIGTDTEIAEVLNDEDNTHAVYNILLKEGKAEASRHIKILVNRKRDGIETKLYQ